VHRLNAPQHSVLAFQGARSTILRAEYSLKYFLRQLELTYINDKESHVLKLVFIATKSAVFFFNPLNVYYIF
jgi:hypothetical protein